MGFAPKSLQILLVHLVLLVPLGLVLYEYLIWVLVNLCQALARRFRSQLQQGKIAASMQIDVVRGRVCTWTVEDDRVRFRNKWTPHAVGGVADVPDRSFYREFVHSSMLYNRL